MNDETSDFEELQAEAHLDYKPTTQERWNQSVQLAQAVINALPSYRVASGHLGLGSRLVDFITPEPNPPLTVFGPDGRFIVSFLADGTWIEANGRISSTAGVIEGSPESLARQFLRVAGIDDRRPPRRPEPARSRARAIAPNPTELLRQLIPKPTNTWRDHVSLPAGQTWDERTPPSICRESPASRLVVTTYDPVSCTFARTRHPRWGVESLRIPRVQLDHHYSMWNLPIEQVRVGDCLITAGVKIPKRDEDQLELDDEFSGLRIWHPQRVVRVEPEGEHHLRVWLAWDNDVKNVNGTPEDLGISINSMRPESKILRDEQAALITEYFQLDVFCRECGNRAKPIIYGMPGPDEPDYFALGGCMIQDDQPRYVCLCGHEWADTKDGRL